MHATPSDHPGRGTLLTNLGNALRVRFEWAAAPEDLDAAIEALDAAAQEMPASHPDSAIATANLGIALRVRFDHTGALADLDAAIGALDAAARAAPPGHSSRAGRLTNLGAAWKARFVRTEELTDLDEAVRACRTAVHETPVGHADLPMYLSNLAAVLLSRFQVTEVPADLEAAIDAGRTAVKAVHGTHPARAVTLSNLGATLGARFLRTGALADLDAAIKTGEAAVEAALPGDPSQVKILYSLGSSLQERFRRTGKRADADAAFSVFAQAAETDSAAPPDRIVAARAAASLVAEPDPDRAADLLESAVELLGEVAPRHLGRSDQQHGLSAFAGLASDAAALALAAAGGGVTDQQRGARALGLLEAGRAVLLSQALDTRDDLTDLRRQRPDLAARFIDLRDRLDRPDSTIPPTVFDSGTSYPAAPRRVAEERRRLAGQLAETLAEIRALEGFGSFGLPPAAEELQAQAVSGPVVTFNVSSYGSHALVLTGSAITPVELPALAHDALLRQVNAFYQALHAATTAGERADRKAAQESMAGILGWLWDAAAEPVLAALGYDREPAPGGRWPRVWWASGGLLGLLPIHAAGHHAEPAAPGQVRRTVMDRVVSSYTPTIRALRYSRRRDAVVASPARTLIVAMATTPGISGRLRYVPAEAAMLCASLPNPTLLTELGTPAGDPPVLPTATPTRENVLAYLPECPIAHFACHGASDPADPSKSLLLLSDYSTDPMTVASLASVRLDRAQLAYLSACRTAFSAAAGLLDEAIHLASAFQLAGFPHVIGTLWEIGDATAVDVARAFYSRLRTGDGSLDISRAAFSLHQAIRAIRDKLPATPSVWAAHLHAGA